MKDVFEAFPISDAEYGELDTKFGRLCFHAAWQLLKKNAKNNHTDELEDIAQELRLAIVRAASYYKRQVYIVRSFQAAVARVDDDFVARILTQLGRLWENRTRHGANKVVFGAPQEELLEQVVRAHVPPGERPDKDAPLEIDTKFVVYCKAITWNCQKSMGKKITREKSMRTGMVSLSEFGHLARDF